MAEANATSTRPYLIRAIYEWCNDNGFTPYIAVAVDNRTNVPREHVRAGEIVLNLSPSATNRLSIGNDWIEFQARFSGAVRELSIPVENVSAIYARENGHGMAFEVAKPLAEPEEKGGAAGGKGSAEAAAAPAALPLPAPVSAAKSSASSPEAPAKAGKLASITSLTPVSGVPDSSSSASVSPSDATDTKADQPTDPGGHDGNGSPSKTKGRAKLTRIK